MTLLSILTIRIIVVLQKHFSAQMLYGANEVEIGKQWANNKLLTSLSKQKEFLGCLKRNNFVSIILSN